MVNGMTEKQAVNLLLKIWSKVAHHFGTGNEPSELGVWRIRNESMGWEAVDKQLVDGLAPYLTDWNFIASNTERLKRDRRLRIRPYVNRDPFGKKVFVFKFPEGRTRQVSFEAFCEIVLAALMKKFPVTLGLAIGLLEDRDGAEFLGRAFIEMRDSFNDVVYWQVFGDLRNQFFVKYSLGEINAGTCLIKALWAVAPPERNRADQLAWADKIDAQMQNMEIPYVANRDLDAWSRGEEGLHRHQAGRDFLTEHIAAHVMIAIYECYQDIQDYVIKPWNWNMSKPGDEYSFLQKSVKGLWRYAKEFGLQHWVEDWEFFERYEVTMAAEPRLWDRWNEFQIPFSDVFALILAIAMTEDGGILGRNSAWVDSTKGLDLLWNASSYLQLDWQMPFGDIESRQTLAVRLDERIRRLGLEDDTLECDMLRELTYRTD